EPRKNLVRVVHAFSRVAARRPDLDLVLAGRWGWRYDDVIEAVVSSPVRVRIHALGHVPEEDLLSLVGHARAVLYPSLLEGFGLPVLEGMAAGAPVLTSDREPLRSLAGDAALTVDPTDEEAIAAGIERLLEDEELRRRLVRRGPRRARGFSWARCAAATLEAYHRVVA
ncbi:MAG: glycosyltransferase family 4 protein, partial [Planctomycetota bacterium]